MEKEQNVQQNLRDSDKRDSWDTEKRCQARWLKAEYGKDGKDGKEGRARWPAISEGRGYRGASDRVESGKRSLKTLLSKLPYTSKAGGYTDKDHCCIVWIPRILQRMSFKQKKKKKKKWLPFETNFRCPCLSPFWGGRWMKLVLVTPLCPPTDSLPLYPENIMQSLSLINTINSKRVSSRINTLSIKFCSAQEEIKICVDRKKIRNWIKYKSKCSIFYFLKITRLC